MARLNQLFCAVTCAVVVVGCTEEKKPPVAMVLEVTSSAPSVLADGTKSVLISVNRTDGVAVKLITSRGSFSDVNTKEVTFETGSGEMTLYTCDSRVVDTCAGTNRVFATSTDGARGVVAVEFLQLELCKVAGDEDDDGKADCADSDCLAEVCQLPGAGTGSCDPSGVCVCNTGTAETCNDGSDNNCDSKTDCEDTTCGGKQCKLATGLGGTCSAGKCSCPNVPEVCSDGIDNDCDGLIDCDDTTCQSTGGAPGQICDSLSRTCTAVIAGKSTCSICSGGQTNETTCNDGKDNDCDGKVDCGDSDCATKTCAAAWKTCDGLTQLCACGGNGGTAEVNEATCSGGHDNDCDGLVDCLDTDCQAAGGATCGTNGLRCTATSTCACGGNGGVAQAKEATCNDGKDNDCDGVSDCADSDCRPVGNALGKVCDNQGNTCSNLSGSVSSCNVCSGNGGSPESAELSCGDAFDNDCDGTIDCQDEGCLGLTCSSTGKVCGQGLTCVCNSQQAETSCADGQDNDCDGLSDCADPHCRPSASAAGKQCSLNGNSCNAAGACVCNPVGGAAQPAGETTCGDGVDNDCDGLEDCQDPNCAPAPGQTFGSNCSPAGTNPSSVGKKCDQSNVCTCPGEQIAEATCGDATDNDCDGKIDCADSDCLAKSCSTGGKTCAMPPSGTVATCSCPTGLSVESNCSDGADNDCDGLVDCADNNCASLACNSASANYQCSASICKDVTLTYTLVVTSSVSRIPADGAAKSTITAALKNNGSPLASQTVSFAVTSGTGTVTASGITDASGVATAIFTAGTTGGNATVTATYVNASSQTISNNTVIDQPKLGQVKFVSQQYSVMGVRFSSYQEANELTFQAVDVNGVGYPAGLTVTFTHSPVATSYIGSSQANCSSTLCTTTGTTVTDGFVKVALHSGQVATVASVSASASAGGLSANATASNLAMIGAKASGAHISVQCTLLTNGYEDTDCTNALSGNTVNCTAFFADRFNNVLGVATLATFSSEAGAAGPPTTTGAYDPATPASSQSGLGQATDFISVNGFKLPLDVAPVGTEFGLTYDPDGCGTKTHNPRDGLSSVIVSAVGEEGFVDGSNGFAADGQYQVGESFIDLPEPFIDSNDNGTRDPSEPYVDSNNSGTWNAANTVWDSNTVIWAETRVLYTGTVQVSSTGAGQIASRWYDPNTQSTPPTAIGTSVPSYSVKAPVTTPTAAPGVPQTLAVYFADLNFNSPLASTNTYYTVASADNATVTASFVLYPSPSGSSPTGYKFSQQYCDANTANPPNCANTCNHVRCSVITSVGSYSHGSRGSVLITGVAPGGATITAAGGGRPLSGIFGVVQ